MAPSKKGPFAHISSIDEVGKALFGTPRRLRFGVWVATMPGTRERTFSVKEYKDWLREKELPGYDNVGVDIKRFVTLDMLELVKPADPRMTTRAKFYRRTTSSLWDVFLIAAVVLKENYEHQEDRVRHAMADLLELRRELQDAIATD